jgi:ubiquinone/menaquinone biosynthesis C-methylase UbiE
MCYGLPPEEHHVRHHLSSISSLSLRQIGLKSERFGEGEISAMLDIKKRVYVWAASTLSVGIVCLLWVAVPSAAQEKSVNPGINDTFENPDLNDIISILEQEERAIYKYRHAIVAALHLTRDLDVADVGSGTGFFTRLIAQEVGPKGNVYAVDIAQKSLDYVEKTAREEGITNITTVLGEHKTTHLPDASVDLIFLCDTYHHFEYPVYMLESIKKSLRDDGRLVVVDFERVKGVTSDRFYEHVRAGKGTFTDEIRDAGFELVKEIPLLKDQYYLVFKKR